MIEQQIYTCEICGYTWGVKELCEKCEALGYPENYNKLLGKWVIVPVSVFFSDKKSETSFEYIPKREWRLVRIDSNYISNLPGAIPTGNSVSPTGSSTTDIEFEKAYGEKLLKTHHRLVVNCKGFEDHTKVDSLKDFFDVPEEMFESLNQKLVSLEFERNGFKQAAIKENDGPLPPVLMNFFTSFEFETRQHEAAQQALAEVVEKIALRLPEIEPEQFVNSILIQS
jgi:hypothetical protein